MQWIFRVQVGALYGQGVGVMALVGGALLHEGRGGRQESYDVVRKQRITGGLIYT